jgi:hypothetical protein
MMSQELMQQRAYIIFEIYNFIGQDLFILNHLDPTNFVRSSHVLKFIFFIFLNNLGWSKDQTKVDNFFIWNNPWSENLVRIPHNMKFKIFIQYRMEKWPKPKVVDLKEIYNVVVDNCYILNHLSRKVLFGIPIFWNSKFSNDLRWRNE